MKRIFTLALLLIAGLTFAQNKNVIFSEDFESYAAGDAFTAETGSWIAYDEDGDGHNWFAFETGEFGMVATSASWSGGTVLFPENWLVSPAIDLTDVSGELELSWTAMGQDADWAQEHYKVVVSTSGNAVADFSDDHIVFEETIPDGDVYIRTADLSAYAGETIHIAFVHYDVSDMFRLNITDIFVTEAEAATYTVTFNVDMQCALFLDPAFDPDVHHVFVTGNFADWAEPGSEGSLQLTPATTKDGEIIFTGVAEVAEGTLYYKYFSDAVAAGWDGGEWAGDPNREVEVTGDLVLNDEWNLGEDCATSVENLVANVSVFPNPAVSELNVKNAQIINEIHVFDLSGRRITSQVVNAYSTVVNVSEFNNGFYILQVVTEGNVESTKFSVER